MVKNEKIVTASEEKREKIISDSEGMQKKG